MPSAARTLLIVICLALSTPAQAQAGMPGFDFTDIANMRLQGISFFLLGLLGSALFVKELWNYVRRDFPCLPLLNFKKALGLVVLWGFLFLLVLTMISGARELMTPGAWEKQGSTYRLKKTEPALPTMSAQERARRQKLDRLRAALWKYAQDHGGRFPAGVSSSDIAPDLWLVSTAPAIRYLFVPGQRADQDSRPLVYEPGIYGSARLALLTNGAIEQMSLEDILKTLPPEKP
jgi:hypothetical protein